MDTTTALSFLRLLAEARPGAGVLHLPDGVSPNDAIRAVRAAVRALDKRKPASSVTAASPTGVTRVHIDGASRGNPGPAGIGVLFVGEDGAVVERIHRGIGIATNNVAEYSALLAALEHARAIGMTDLEIYSDSELLVRQLQGRYQVKHLSLRPLHTAARELIAGLNRFAIHHVPRELNREADALANRGIDEAARRTDRFQASPGNGVD